VKYVKKAKWDGMIPNPRDLIYNIESARKLNKMIEE